VSAGHPSTAQLETLAEQALERCVGEAQVSVSHERSLLSRFARSQPTQATGIDALHVEIMCVYEGHTGAATTTSCAVGDLETTAAAARAAAEAAANAAGSVGDYPGLPAPDPHWRAQPHDGFDAATAAVDPGSAGRALQDAAGVAAEHRTEAFGTWTAGAVRTAIASTTGVRVTDAVTDAYMRVLCYRPDGRSGFAARSARDAAQLDGAALTGEAAAKAIVAGVPAVLAPGEYAVVMEPEAIGELLGFAGALAFNGLAHNEGRGALAGRLGARVAAAAINLADAPRASLTLPRAFDAEGIPKRPIPLIQDGVAHAVVHDTRSAARAGPGARSTGHALAPGGDPDGPVPTNLVLSGGGAADVAELCAPIVRGIYVTRLWYVNTVRERETLLTGMTRDGTFLIEDGRIGRPLRDVRFTDSVLRLLDAIEALTKTQRLVSAGDFYGPRFAFGVVSPALRARGFRVSGTTPG